MKQGVNDVLVAYTYIGGLFRLISVAKFCSQARMPDIWTLLLIWM